MIPNKISQTFLDRQALPGEALAVVVRANGSGLGSFVVQGRSNKAFSFQFNKRAGGHILRFPASFWTASKEAIARELYDRNLPVALIPSVEPWDASRALSDLTLVPLEAQPAEEALAVPDKDLTPGASGLAPVIATTPDDIAAARVEGRNDFAAGIAASDNPFDISVLPELHQAWKEGFEAAESDAAKSPPDADAAAHSALTGIPDDLAATDEETESESEDPAPEPEQAAEDQPAAAPAPYELRGGDIFRTGTEERVGGIFDPGDHLRMATGLKDEREDVLAWLATLPAKEPAPVTE